MFVVFNEGQVNFGQKIDYTLLMQRITVKEFERKTGTARKKFSDSIEKFKNWNQTQTRCQKDRTYTPELNLDISRQVSDFDCSHELKPAHSHAQTRQGCKP